MYFQSFPFFCYIHLKPWLFCFLFTLQRSSRTPSRPVCVQGPGVRTRSKPCSTRRGRLSIRTRLHTGLIPVQTVVLPGFPSPGGQLCISTLTPMRDYFWIAFPPPFLQQKQTSKRFHPPKNVKAILSWLPLILPDYKMR